MNTIVKVNLEEVLGHFVEAEITLQGYYGKVTKTLTGRIIYSGHNASLFFKPKGSKNKGYPIQDEQDVQSVKIIRKDKSSNEYYVNAYNHKENYKMELEKREELEQREREEQEIARKERFELERKKKLEAEQKEIEEARELGGYEKLEQDVIDFYQSFEGEFFNEKFVKGTFIPILNKLINKGIKNVNDYPKHYFDKKQNPKFCSLIENKLNIKLKNTQKYNVEALNNYLAN